MVRVAIIRGVLEDASRTRRGEVGSIARHGSTEAVRGWSWSLDDYQIAGCLFTCDSDEQRLVVCRRVVAVDKEVAREGRLVDRGRSRSSKQHDGYER